MNLYCQTDPDTHFFKLKPNSLVLEAEPKPTENAREYDANELVMIASRFGFEYLNIHGSKVPVPKTIGLQKDKNILFYEQYILTKNKNWLNKIQPDGLLCMCHLTKNGDVEFASGEKDGITYVLSFTKNRFSIFKQAMIDRGYQDFMVIRLPEGKFNYVINFEVTRIVE